MGNKMKKHLGQKGIAHPMMIVGIVVVVAVISYAVYRVYSTKSSTMNGKTPISKVEAIASKDDLKQVVDSIKQNATENDTKLEEQKLKELTN